ncbi:MAG: FRG domain-containing protein [Phycisphaerales bacterium JB060]
MLVRECKSWSAFLERIDGYLKKPLLVRRSFVFRGQGDANWDLSTTLDRYVSRIGSWDPTESRTRLLSEFRMESAGLRDAAPGIRFGSTQDELLGRHHGLPSPILDWSRSPYVAAFFAFADQVHQQSQPPENVAIWGFDLKGITADPTDSSLLDEVEVIDDPLAISLNPRAIEQESVFIRIDERARRMDQLLPDYLRKFVVPATERDFVLEVLDEMRINERSLFRDLDSAARTAARRVRMMERLK